MESTTNILLDPRAAPVVWIVFLLILSCVQVVEWLRDRRRRPRLHSDIWYASTIAAWIVLAVLLRVATELRSPKLEAAVLAAATASVAVVIVDLMRVGVLSRQKSRVVYWLGITGVVGFAVETVAAIGLVVWVL